MAINGPTPEPRNTNVQTDNQVLIEYLLNERRAGPALNPARVISYVSRLNPASMEPEKRQATEELFENHIGKDRRVAREVVGMLEKSEASGNTAEIAQNLQLAMRLGLHKSLPSFPQTYSVIKERWGLRDLPDLIQSPTKEQAVTQQIEAFVENAEVTPEERHNRRNIIDALNKLLSAGKTMEEVMAILGKEYEGPKSGKPRPGKRLSRRWVLGAGALATGAALLKNPLANFLGGFGKPASALTLPGNSSEGTGNQEAEPVQTDIIKDVIAPRLMESANERREQFQKEPWAGAIDTELNKGRFNIVFLGEGVEDEEFTDSVIALSYGTGDNSFSMFNILRDTHAPEIDRYKTARTGPGPSSTWNAINMAYIEGKYPLVREVIADATGLSPDFIVKSKIEGFVYFIADALGKVKIEIPETIDTTTVGYTYKWEKGTQYLTAKELSDYARSRVVTGDEAREGRQLEVVKSLLENLKERWRDGSRTDQIQLLFSLRQSWKKQQDLGNLSADFDLEGLVLSQLGPLAAKMASSKFSHEQVVLNMPALNTTVLGSQFGLTPEHRADVSRPYLLTIKGGNHQAPYLPEGYWRKFRQGIRRVLRKPSVEEIAIPETGNYYGELLKPLLQEISMRRQEKSRDPEYAHRVDPELNKDRINIVIYSFGQMFEPPLTSPNVIGSTTVVSLNYRTGGVDLVSWSHDTRAREVEEELARRGLKNIKAQKMDQVYPTGGIPLLEKVTEDLTGLSADLTLAFGDDLIAEGINQIFGKVKVNVPMSIDVHPYYINDVRYPADKFTQGQEEMDGRRIIQFIKTQPTNSTDPKAMQSFRKNQVLADLSNHVKGNFMNIFMWTKLGDFFQKTIAEQKIDSESDLRVIDELFTHIKSILPQAGVAAAGGKLPLPQLHSKLYISDPSDGDGGVKWVTSIQDFDPAVKRDLIPAFIQTGLLKYPLTLTPILRTWYGTIGIQHEDWSNQL